MGEAIIGVWFWFVEWPELTYSVIEVCDKSKDAIKLIRDHFESKYSEYDNNNKGKLGYTNVIKISYFCLVIFV